MSVKNYVVVYEKDISSIAVYVVPEGKDISEFIKDKPVIRQSAFSPKKK